MTAASSSRISSRAEAAFSSACAAHSSGVAQAEPPELLPLLVSLELPSTAPVVDELAVEAPVTVETPALVLLLEAALSVSVSIDSLASA